jgi:hypothetical protein
VKGVGVMKDTELKLEEIETSHTLGGYRRCRCYSAVRYTTGLVVELEHLKIKTRFIDEKFESVRGECEI